MCVYIVVHVLSIIFAYSTLELSEFVSCTDQSTCSSSNIEARYGVVPYIRDSVCFSGQCLPFIQTERQSNFIDSLVDTIIAEFPHSLAYILRQIQNVQTL